MVQTNTLDTALSGDRRAHVTIETMHNRLLDGWERLGNLLFSRI